MRPHAKLMIVETVPTRRIMLTVLLGAAGYHVIQCGSLTEMDRTLSRNDIDLVLTSLALPDGPADTVPKRIKKIRPDRDVPVIGLADQNDRAARLKALGAGLDDVLMMPVPDRLLLARVTSLLRRPSSPNPAPLTSQVEPGSAFRETCPPFTHASQMALVAIAGSGGDTLQQCLHTLDGHVDIQIFPGGRIDLEEQPQRPDCVILGTSTAEDMALLRNARQSVPYRGPHILALTTEALWADTLCAGADDAIIAPFCERELLIRVRSLMRRRFLQTAAAPKRATTSQRATYGAPHPAPEWAPVQ